MKETIDRCIKMSGVCAFETEIEVPATVVQDGNVALKNIATSLAEFMLEHGLVELETSLANDPNNLLVKCVFVPTSMVHIRAMLGMAYEEGKQDGQAKLGALMCLPAPAPVEQPSSKKLPTLPTEQFNFNKPFNEWSNAEIDAASGDTILKAFAEVAWKDFKGDQTRMLVEMMSHVQNNILCADDTNSTPDSRERLRKTNEALKRAQRALHPI